MAKYRVLQKSFIGGRIVDEGEIVDYEGEVSDNLELIKERKGKAAATEADDSSSDGEVSA